MTDVADHYENLLAEHYTWMFGADFDSLVVEQRALLDWNLSKSSYRKLRLAHTRVAEQLTEAGFSVEEPSRASRGMYVICARRR